VVLKFLDNAAKSIRQDLEAIYYLVFARRELLCFFLCITYEVLGGVASAIAPQLQYRGSPGSE
jgi:hypothetical protein